MYIYNTALLLCQNGEDLMLTNYFIGNPYGVSIVRKNILQFLIRQENGLLSASYNVNSFMLVKSMHV